MQLQSVMLSILISAITCSDQQRGVHLLFGRRYLMPLLQKQGICCVVTFTLAYTSCNHFCICCSVQIFILLHGSPAALIHHPINMQKGDENQVYHRTLLHTSKHKIWQSLHTSPLIYCFAVAGA